MKIFLDTADVKAVRRFAGMGVVDGVTTNPTLLAREGGDPEAAMAEMVGAVEGDVSLEVVSTDSASMIEEGKRLRRHGGNVVVKVPMTSDGLRACSALSSEEIPVNVTLVFSANQALLAAKAGAAYVSPFIGRLDDAGQDGMGLVRDMAEIFENYEMGAEILVASVRHPVHVLEAAKAGADVATVPPAVLEKMLRHPLTDIGLAAFLADWEAARAARAGK
ncbi:MAG: fructose-6-phosphate aldolase [Nitrosopumilus sp.]|nr:fructose-6-phosphate aldolase [Nitrosopumilus sp.]MDA7959749.1 fructose-6-phosphate aldolase [Nitrosopumilus sp.]